MKEKTAHQDRKNHHLVLSCFSFVQFQVHLSVVDIEKGKGCHRWSISTVLHVKCLYVVPRCAYLIKMAFTRFYIGFVEVEGRWVATFTCADNQTRILRRVLARSNQNDRLVLVVV